MKKILTAFLIALSISATSQAVLINITMSPDGTTKVDDIAKNDNPTGSNSNSSANHLAWLADHVIPDYNAWKPATLPSPSGLALIVNEGDVSSNGVPTFDLSDIVYITYHYGKGSGGIGSGGGIVAIYNDGMSGSYTPPSSGAGPNGLGGLSTVYAWGREVSVPDTGSTLILLGLGLGLLGFLKRRK